MLDEGMRSPQTDCFIDVDANLRRSGNISTAAEPNLLRPHAAQRYISGSMVSFGLKCYHKKYG